MFNGKGKYVGFMQALTLIAKDLEKEFEFFLGLKTPLSNIKEG